MDKKNGQDSMAKIITDLRKKMTEIDSLANELERKRILEKCETPTKTKRLLEEIKVPALELLKEE